MYQDREKLNQTELWVALKQAARNQTQQDEPPAPSLSGPPNRFTGTS